MVSLSSRRRVAPAIVTALAFTFLALRLIADDQIIKTDGSAINGKILGASDGQVMIQSTASNGGVAQFPIGLSDIKSVAMATPADVAKAEAQGVSPAALIAALEPQVKEYAGVPADWVVDAMVRLAQAYSSQGQTDRALATYSKIDTLYPGSKYHLQAVTGKAELDLKSGRAGDALSALQPIIDQANKDIAPSPSNGAIYAYAFLIYGKALEAQKKPQQALEAYLTVKTMFYQNPALVAQADQLATTLRDQNPGLGVE
ncbi:MAG: tetratricopeptide repeat protein [Methylacidiphilales bacterium]|nr:tetratricopeptide repeat protein [Candidatus Methylacidiphilales bacterium]